MWEQEQIEEMLTEKEAKALRVWRLDPSQRPLSTELALRMQVMYMNGYVCEQIADEFKGINLGAIIQARITFQWDKARQEYNDKIRNSLIERHSRAGLETAQTVLDLLYCANDDLNKRAKDYMTGRSSTPPVKTETVAQYKALVELALRTLENRSPLPNSENKPNASNEVEIDDPDKIVIDSNSTIPNQLSQLVRIRKGTINA